MKNYTKLVLPFLFVLLNTTVSGQQKGFNWGQMFSFINEQHGALDSIPTEVVNLIKDKVPYEYLQNARFSGTMSNYMVLDELGYGEHMEQFSQWQILTNRLSKPERDEITQAVAKTSLKQIPLIGLFIKGANTPEQNMELLLSKTKKYTPSSFLVNFVNAVKQLGVKNVEFTFNSHTPYRKIHSLEESLNSLRYVYNRTNLTHVELENETYLADYICGKGNLSEKKAREQILPYYTYLENIVVPEIVKIVGKNTPLGFSIINNSTGKRKAYNKVVKETVDRLKGKGYNIYLTPHCYFSSTGEETIREELKSIISFYGKDYKYRMTEFNLDSDIKGIPELNQQETIQFYELVSKVAKEEGVDAIYYHCIYTKPRAFYSFIK